MSEKTDDIFEELIKKGWGENVDIIQEHITNLQQENKQLKEKIEEIYLWAINSKYKLDTLPPNYSYVIDGNRLKELLEILGDKENE